jgi:hypothetical protein
MLFDLKVTPAEYTAGLNLAIERGWLEKHESGTYVKFTQAAAELFGMTTYARCEDCGCMLPHQLQPNSSCLYRSSSGCTQT